jgi:ribonuclease J
MVFPGPLGYLHRAVNGSVGPRGVRFVPLGGLGEVGMNCFALEQDDGILVVDCGITFPSEDLGIEVLHPDFSYLNENAERISGVFLTHGHEDHIGALPYLLEEIETTVWGPAHALGLARRRIEEHDFDEDDVRFETAVPGKRYRVGPFEVEPVRVAHSICEATALCIRTRGGTLLHTGDFNFDPTPPDGEPTDEARLKALGDQGIDLLLSDSTNVDVPGEGGSERGVGAALERIVAGARARVFVALFASNVQRLMLLGEIARKTGRRLCLLGRSLLVNHEIASEIGRLRWPSDLLIGPEQARGWPRDRLLVLAGGTQAEPASAMRRLAAGTHRDLSIEPGDTVVVSARVIPGNERAISGMLTDLLRLGALVHTRVSDPQVHTSGHATRLEQQRMLELTRPRCFLPVHGTLHHLSRHAELAHSRDVGSVLVVENGTTAVLESGKLRLGGTVRAGAVSIAQGGEPLDPDTLRRRAELGRSGLVTVAAAVDAGGHVVAGPSVVARGIPGVDADGWSQRALAAEVVRALERVMGRRNPGDAAEEVRRAVRRKLEEIAGVRPVIDVHLLGPGARRD